MIDQYKRKSFAKKGAEKGREKGKRTEGGKDKGKGKTDTPSGGCFNCGGANFKRDCKEPAKN